MKMLRRSNANGLASGNKLHKRCSGHSTHRSRKNYKSRASTSASATSNGDSANTTKAVQVKAAVKKGESSDKTSSSAKVFSTQAPKTTTTTSANSESTSSSSSSAAGNYDGGDTSGKGLFGVSDSTCGDSGASETPTNDGGPNGKQSWLNCGVSGGGWVSRRVAASYVNGSLTLAFADSSFVRLSPPSFSGLNLTLPSLTGLSSRSSRLSRSTPRSRWTTACSPLASLTFRTSTRLAPSTTSLPFFSPPSPCRRVSDYLFRSLAAWCAASPIKGSQS